MKLESKILFDTVCNKKINNFIHAINDYHNEIIYRIPKEDSKLISYLEDLSDIYMQMSNAIKSINNCLEKMCEISLTIDSLKTNEFLLKIENELMSYYIKLKSSFDVLLRLIIKTYDMNAPRHIINLQNILKRSELKSSDISIQLKSLDDAIKNFDGGKRNEIIHENKYTDETIEDLRIFLIVGRKLLKTESKFELALKGKKIELINQKIRLLNDMNKIVLEKLSAIHDLLEKVYIEKKGSLFDNSRSI